MRLNFWQQIILTCLVLFASSLGALAHGEVFSGYSFDQAQEKAQQEGKLLLIDFTATWCPPCKKMESTTWVDESVKNWLKENAIAIQVDVDKNKSLVSKLKVKAMPTMVLFTPQNESKEFGRKVGYTNSSELLIWLKGARSGKSADEVKKETAKLDSSAIWERISKARELQTKALHTEALDEYLWLWKNLKNAGSNLAMVRNSMIPREMMNLTKFLPEAKTKFMEIRDRAEKTNNRQDWIILNSVLNDNKRTLAWFDKIKIDPKEQSAIKENKALLERILFNEKRWSDAADYLYPEPLKQINEYYKRAQKMKQPGPHTEVAKGYDPFPSMVLLLYGAYVGAAREKVAKEIADECIRLDDTPSMRKSLAITEKNMKQARSTKIK